MMPQAANYRPNHAQLRAWLCPFASDAYGVVRFAKWEMKTEAEATYDSGLMDYCAIESAYDMIEIRPLSIPEIERAILLAQRRGRHFLTGRPRGGKRLVNSLHFSGRRQILRLRFPKSLR